ncbi:MAG: outer membrane lipoprotein carrier protein LolA [Chitinophagales bacterium]|nr:outer membrane lipoprotein carrier protein LolA [Chitinophagales bacterium]
MRKVLTICVLLLTVATQQAWAQTDQKAKEILDASNKKIKNLKSLKSDFSLELLGGGVTDKKTGTFYMKGEKYRVEMEKKEVVIINNNKTAWTYMKATNEVQVVTSDPSEQALSPAKLLTNFYDKEYNYKYAGLRKIDGKTCDVIELTPKASDKAFTKVELAIDKTANTIVGGQVWEKNGNTYRYTLSNYKPNYVISDAMFTFSDKEFPGADVIDLR